MCPENSCLAIQLYDILPTDTPFLFTHHRIILFWDFDIASGIILCMRPANEIRRYSVTPSLIGWAHTQYDFLLNAGYWVDFFFLSSSLHSLIHTIHNRSVSGDWSPISAELVPREAPTMIWPDNNRHHKSINHHWPVLLRKLTLVKFNRLWISVEVSLKLGQLPYWIRQCASWIGILSFSVPVTFLTSILGFDTL